jgi:cation diffusion facilitator family transporter
VNDDHTHELQGHRGHHHAHDHPHDHEHAAGIRGLLGEIFRPHSHDASDSIDTALEATDRGIRAVKISFAALFVTSMLQLVVVVLTSSIALLADTIHNFSDALTAVPLFLAFRLSRRPPTRRYTYGYRRAEDLAGVFVVAMITLSSIVAGWEAVRRLIHPHHIDHVGALLAAGIIGFVGNELVALYRIREGNAIGSAALVADGYHARTDGFTSLAVALGAIGVWAGFDRADPVVGLGISIAILAVLIGAAREIYYRLMDAVDPRIVDGVEQVAHTTTGVVAVGATQARWLGHRLVADLAITVDENLPVREGHEIAEQVRHRLLHEVRHLDDANVHVDPAGTDPHQLTGHHRRS